ncbi:MAG: HIT domain-containing protein [Candidatus Dormiibacterota bacterium]
MTAEDRSDRPTPDAAQPIWAPWRMEYLKAPQSEGCPLCEALENDRLILHRGEKAFVIMNLYPYANGHVMVAPVAHLSQIKDLSPETAAEIMELTHRSMDAIDKVSSPQGFNIGYNLGRAAGAGIDDHIHQHVVPRWLGDTNFFPVLAGRKTIGEAVQETLDKLKPVF